MLEPFNGNRSMESSNRDCFAMDDSFDFNRKFSEKKVEGITGDGDNLTFAPTSEQ